MHHLLLIIEEILQSIYYFDRPLCSITSSTKYSPHPKNQKYSASFGKEKDLLSSRHDGFAIGAKKSVSRELSYRNQLVVGPTGSGKSAGIFQPSIYRMSARPNAPSFIVHDPSGELYQASARAPSPTRIRCPHLGLE